MHSDKRHCDWLGKLFDGSVSDIPNREAQALAICFVTYLDGVLRSEPDHETGWRRETSVLHEWTIRGLNRGTPFLRDRIWGWLEILIAECEGNRLRQIDLGEGLFDDLLDSKERWNCPAWAFAANKILRCLSRKETAWVAYDAFDNDVELMLDTLSEYLLTQASSDYDGPRDRNQIANAYHLWLKGG